MKLSFGSRELCKCLECLGFRQQPQKATNHVKYEAPSNKKVPPGVRPFIIVILGRKSYDPHTRTRYLRQIKNLGFSEKEIRKCL